MHYSYNFNIVAMLTYILTANNVIQYINGQFFILVNVPFIFVLRWILYVWFEIVGLRSQQNLIM